MEYKTIFKVTVKQEINRNSEWVDASFTEYFDTMHGAWCVVNRFKDCDNPAEADYRRVTSIKIKTITLKVGS